MQHNEGHFSGVHNHDLYYQCWLPRGETRAVVVIVHGFSDHCGRYDNLVSALIRHHFAVYGYDLRGHGRSPGKSGHIESFDDYRQDTHAFINFVSTKHPGIPLYLFGHSMGGLIALDQALYYPAELSGVISSAAHLGNPPVSTTKLALGHLMSKVWPSLSMNAGLDETALTRDESAVQAYRDDPLVHGRGTARLATELENAVAETQANAYRLKPPLLIYFGTDDRLTNPQDSRRFYNNVRSAEKKLVIYEGGQHESHNDIHSERVCIEVAQWIEAQILTASQPHEHQDSIDG